MSIAVTACGSKLTSGVCVEYAAVARSGTRTAGTCIRLAEILVSVRAGRIARSTVGRIIRETSIEFVSKVLRAQRTGSYRLHVASSTKLRHVEESQFAAKVQIV